MTTLLQLVAYMTVLTGSRSCPLRSCATANGHWME